MELIVSRVGSVLGVYGEELDLSALGVVTIQRASHVEPDDCGRWWADLAAVGGPRLGPFAVRSRALAAEVAWLSEWLTSSGELGKV